MDVSRTALPGLGHCARFTTRDGEEFGVITLRTGEVELVHYRPEDQDTAEIVMRLTPAEAHAVSCLLGQGDIGRGMG